jgi:hypothetical protein
VTTVYSNGKTMSWREALDQYVDGLETDVEKEAVLLGAAYALQIAFGIPRVKSERQQIEDMRLAVLDSGEERGLWKVNYPNGRKNGD